MKELKLNRNRINLPHRITYLERWGMRVHADFQPESVACVRDLMGRLLADYNMRLFLSRDDFPHTPDDVFHLTATPYSV